MSDTQQKAAAAAPAPEEAPAPARPSKIKAWLKPARNGLLVYFLFLMMCSGLSLMGFSTYIFVKFYLPHGENAHVVAENHGETSHGDETTESHAANEHDTDNGMTADGGVVLGASPLPKSVLKARDGQMEAGHDLIEPEITANREVASLIKGGDMKVDLGSRFASIPDVFTSLRDGRKQDGMVNMSFSFEVNSTALQNEIEARGTEIQSMIASLVGGRSKDEIMNSKGLLLFKTDVLRELNLMLSSGKVSDVYVTEFHVR